MGVVLWLRAYLTQSVGLSVLKKCKPNQGSSLPLGTGQGAKDMT